MRWSSLQILLCLLGIPAITQSFLLGRFELPNPRPVFHLSAGNEIASESDSLLLRGLRESNKDTKSQENSQFVNWLKENGVWVSSNSAWGRAPHPLVIASQTEDDGEVCGRGLLAKEGISQGELLLTIPLDLCLTRTAAQQSLGKELVPDGLDEYLAIALLLVVERLKGPQSLWAPYFAVLPAAQEVYPAFMWGDEDMAQLLGSPVHSAAASLRAKVLREHSDMLRRLSAFPAASSERTALPVEELTEDSWLWAFAILFSRAARLASAEGAEPVLALVPYADLLNHSPYSSAFLDAQRAGLPLVSRRQEVAVYADRSYKKFEQVFISYGKKGNGDLLLLYGFALDRNPFDAVEVTVGLSPQDPLYSAKKAFLEKAGRGALSVRFPLQLGRYPTALVDFLRLLLAGAEDLGMQALADTDFNSPLTPSLERRVLDALVDICAAYLRRYPTTLAQDEALLADKKLFAALSRQQRMAVKLRLSEKRILQDTITAVAAEASALPVSANKSTKTTWTSSVIDLVEIKRDSVSPSQARRARRKKAQET